MSRPSVAGLVRCMAAGAAGLVVLAGCGGGAGAQAPAAPAVAASPAILRIYETTCKSCHAVPASGAPQAFDAKAWAARVAQGRQVLIEHAIDGYKGMPPMGMCPQCSEEDFTALIEYMSGSRLH